jgi:hypothetical protein
MGKAARKTAALKALAREWTKFDYVELTGELRDRWPQLKHATSVWANSRFEVHIYAITTEIGGVNQVNIARHGQIEDVSYEDAQRVVHDIFGPEVTAVEIYPPFEYEWQTRIRVKVLWVLPYTWHLPFGLHFPNAWGKPE